MARKTTEGQSQATAETRQKHIRRAERGRLVAKLGEVGSPWGSAAAAAHKEVSALEDTLQAKRTALMAILKSAKVA